MKIASMPVFWILDFLIIVNTICNVKVIVHTKCVVWGQIYKILFLKHVLIDRKYHYILVIVV